MLRLVWLLLSPFTNTRQTASAKTSNPRLGERLERHRCLPKTKKCVNLRAFVSAHVESHPAASPVGRSAAPAKQMSEAGNTAVHELCRERHPSFLALKGRESRTAYVDERCCLGVEASPFDGVESLDNSAPFGGQTG